MRGRCSKRLTGPVAPEAGAARCRSRITSAGAGARASSRRIRLGHEAAVRRHRADSRAAPSGDQWVVRANHRDGWVFGAWDPLSGTRRDDGGSKSDRRAARRAAGDRSARSSTRAGTARSRACLAPPNGLRRTRRAATQRSAVSELRRQCARFLEPRREATRCNVSPTTSRPTSRIPRPERPFRSACAHEFSSRIR